MKFLVLLAFTCLSAQYLTIEAKSTEHVASLPAAPEPESSYEIVGVIHHEKKEHKPKEKKTHKEVIKHITKKEKKPVADCNTKTLEERERCEKSATAEYTSTFNLKEDTDECKWTCDFTAVSTIAPATKPEPEAVKELKHGKRTATKKVTKTRKIKKNKKECEGEKKIVFNNCLVKLRGLIAWGDETKNFDKKFDKFLTKSNKKVKKAKKAAPKEEVVTAE